MSGLRPLILIAAACGAMVSGGGRVVAGHPAGDGGFAALAALEWPPGTEIVRFENIEGMMLVPAALRGYAGADTSGPLALDTGAGYLALDVGLARVLGVADWVGTPAAVALAARPLPRLRLGDWALDQLEPVLTMEAEIVRRVSDRPVLGLLGQKPLRDRVVWIDYRESVVAFVPAFGSRETTQVSSSTLLRGSSVGRPEGMARAARSRGQLAGLLSREAVAVPFRLVGDGKMLVRGAVSDPRPPRFSEPLNLLIDTGATKCVLFEDLLSARLRRAHDRPVLRGLSAPTLIGAAVARLTRLPALEIEAENGALRVRDVDVGLLRTELAGVLARVSGEPIHGLIGYSLLKRFRVAVDYPNQVLWLDPIPGYRDARPHEYCHVGLQLERRAGAVVVTAVAERSPAARAGIARGDELVALDGTPARTLDLIDLTRRMEGAPGRPVTLVIRRDAVERTHRLVRRRLL